MFASFRVIFISSSFSFLKNAFGCRLRFIFGFGAANLLLKFHQRKTAEGSGDPGVSFPQFLLILKLRSHLIHPYGTASIMNRCNCSFGRVMGTKGGDEGTKGRGERRGGGEGIEAAKTDRQVSCGIRRQSCQIFWLLRIFSCLKSDADPKQKKRRKNKRKHEKKFLMEFRSRSDI